MPFLYKIPISLFFFFFSLPHLFGQESLEEKLKSAEGGERLKILLDLSHQYIQSAPEMAVEYGKEAYSLSEQRDNTSGMVQASILLGNAYEVLKNYNSAKYHYERALTLYGTSGDNSNIAYLNERTGHMLKLIGQHEKAEPLLKKALALYTSIKDSRGKGAVYNIYGDSYFDQKRYKDAIEMYKQAYVEHDRSNDNRAKTSDLMEAGAAWSDFGNVEEALNCFNEALTLANTKNLPDLLPFINKNIETVRDNIKKLNQNQEQKTQYEELTEQKEQEYVKDVEQKNVQFKMQQVKTLGEIEKLSKENQLKEYKIRIQHDEYNQQLLVKENEVLQQKQAVAKKGMESEKKQREIILLQKDRALQEGELARQKMINYSILGGIALLFVIILLVLNAYRQKRKANKSLEQKNKVISEQNDQIEKKNQTIISSIEYAKRIQEVTLSPQEKLKSIFPDSFIFYKAKDILSGDFYWISQPKPESAILAVCDCTGHGVPGAFMSLLGFNMLKEAIQKNPYGSPADILTTLNILVCNMLLQQQDGATSHYGMDMAMIKLDINGKTLQFAGAHNPLFILRNGELIEKKAEKHGVGIKAGVGQTLFTNQLMSLNSGDRIYIFSDGYTDQLGGPEKRKFYKESLKKLIINTGIFSIEEQRKKFEEEHRAWKGNNPQTDDILVIGMAIK